MWSFYVTEANKRSLNLLILVNEVCYYRIKAKVVTASPQIEGEMYI
jgi:hypothetical protein